MEKTTTVIASWDAYHRTMSGIASEMVGAARYLAEHPDYATDETVADTFRRYAARLAAVEVPR